LVIRNALSRLIAMTRRIANWSTEGLVREPLKKHAGS
jgi:hypothetical protein